MSAGQVSHSPVHCMSLKVERWRQLGTLPSLRRTAELVRCVVTVLLKMVASLRHTGCAGNWGGLRLGFRRTQGCETGRKRVPGSHPSALSAPRGVGRRRRSRSRVSALSGGPRSSLRLASFKDTPDNRSVNFSDGHASSDAGITRVSCFVRTTQRKKGSAGGPYGIEA